MGKTRTEYEYDPDTGELLTARDYENGKLVGILSFAAWHRCEMAQKYMTDQERLDYGIE